MAKKYTGYTEKTMQNRATGAGAYLKNYDVTTDTFTTAVEAGKLIGATQGGGTFSAKPTIRSIQVDGINGKAKGLQEIDAWDVNMTANVLEITAETLAMALGASTISDSTTPTGYKKVAGKSVIELGDYQDNITFIGNVSGFTEPIIIQVFNALSLDGLSYDAKDGGDTVIPMNWVGHYSDTNTEEPPFAIWVPVQAE